MSLKQCDMHSADLAGRIIETAAAHGLTVCSMESLTAGLFCSTLASVPGASAVLAGGLVTYQTRIKEEVGHVPADIIQKYGVISSQCARAMAESGRKLFSADICVSFTGNAGPSAMEDKPAGTVFAAIATKNGCRTVSMHLEGERNSVRAQAVEVMLKELAQALETVIESGGKE